MSHLPEWERLGISYAQYAARQDAIVDRAYALTKDGLTVHEAVESALLEMNQ